MLPRLKWLGDVMARHVDSGDMGGVAWLAACGDDLDVGFAGVLTHGESAPVHHDSIFRIASMTKPVVAVGALLLVEECRLRLDEPVDELLPELADRRVLVEPRGPIDGETVPAHRPITVRDVMTFQLGLGMDFSAPWPQPLLEAMGALGLGDGPPQPQEPPEPDEWMRLLGTLPLLYHPGRRDPAVFPDPDRFDVTRHPTSVMTFGFGTHFCLGVHLARAEIDVALASSSSGSPTCASTRPTASASRDHPPPPPRPQPAPDRLRLTRPQVG